MVNREAKRGGPLLALRRPRRPRRRRPQARSDGMRRLALAKRLGGLTSKRRREAKAWPSASRSEKKRLSAGWRKLLSCGGGGASRKASAAWRRRRRNIKAAASRGNLKEKALRRRRKLSASGQLSGAALESFSLNESSRNQYVKPICNQ